LSYTTDSSLNKIITLGVIDHYQCYLTTILYMLINHYIFIFEMCSILAIIGLIINRKHLLIALLYLEAFMLSLVIIIPLSIIIFSSQSIFISIVLLSVGACEASLGLALIVIISRTYGSDLIRSVTINKC